MPEYVTTPTEDLILDTLIARARLGENVWPFTTKFQRQCERLASQGWVTVGSGNVNGTIRVALTAHGRREFIDNVTYVAPLEQRIADTVQSVLLIIDPKNYPVGDELRKAQKMLKALAKS